MSASKKNIDADKDVSGSPQSRAAIILKANLFNLAKKVAKGKTLSAVEIRLLRESEASQSLPDTDFAKNQVELAAALDISRKTIERYKKRDDAPTPRADGRLCISEWKAFLARHNVLDESDGGDDLNATELKAKQILLQNQKLEHQLAVLREEYMATVDVEKMVADMVQNAKRVLLAGPPSLAPQVVGVTIPEAETILRQWLYDALSAMHQDPLGKEVANESV
ncbi:MAG TPA: hypothetical protein VFB72_11100 [Verrucomicrobiae bacterium]|nr:hypothetical protein [Verrucomicrobiae bacterium]